MSTAFTPDDITHYLPPDFLAKSLRRDVLAGLGSAPKTLPPKWFYDQRGSELFERITLLQEYYPTRAEREALELHAAEIAAAAPAETLMELGSGSSRKTPLLLDALAAAGPLRRYVAVDVSDSALLAAREELTELYPALDLQAVAADFEHQMHLLPHEGRRMIAFLGGTIGNFEPEARREFLRSIRGHLGPGEGTLLIGTDMVKAPSVLLPAYDDAGGVTAEFNRNVLRVLNAELGADFDVDAFEHVAVWNERQEWVEMWLRATRPMHVRLPAVGLEVDFAAGEDLRTEISAKFRPEGFAAELAEAGFAVVGQWTDAAGRFALTLAEPRA
ncbi:L-histidine N(alpha)-methyltransferase [Arthrobacter sp. I2-34]|uniref:Histidine N-alpha-methyltransferase n=1 Tax=Arthrobacter hankyongi TaxID=2904801 RepID=A0ABS9LAG1_9MICC|nr:L-histidine N(alpha)-methyltransferase [Arthrobacter hankyongi]MCG2623667.1 L-histidine N(alpha)-methyltransferase [Arthrobacter hankyongi]